MQKGSNLPNCATPFPLFLQAIVAILMVVAVPSISLAQSFTSQATTLGINTSGVKEAGLCWADFNNDGRLDHIVNTLSSTNNSRIYFQNSGGTFTDVTATHANGLDDTQKARSVVAGDFNNDGALDFALCDAFLVEIWINKGASATPAYSFGNASQNPNQSFTSLTGGLNAEGLLTVDYDNDGDLDLILDNHAFGIDILSNNGAGSFTQVDNATTGLPVSSGNGDFAAAGDFNNDGYVDICVRRSVNADIYLNDGDGTFTANAFDQNASNSNKGAVAWGDLDSDGDLDLVWTDAGTNQIWRNDNGTFTATSEPGASAGIDLSTATIDGVTIADIDNDGDLDVFFANIHTESYLFVNQNPGSLSFTRPASPVNFGIAPGGDAEGASFVDVDNDGDMDLSVSMATLNNQLWINGLNSSSFLKVNAHWDFGAGATSMANGATAALFDCNNNRISPLMNLAAGESQGCFGVPVFHFGGVDPAQTYYVRVYFPFRNGVRSVITREVVPANEPNQTITVLNTNSSDVFNCPAIPVAQDDAFFVLAGDQLYGNVGGNDIGDPVLTYSLVDGGTATANGTLTFEADGSFGYLSSLPAGSTVTFTYSICNVNGCDEAEVTIGIFEEGEPVCANPGVDGSVNVSSSINTYYPIPKTTLVSAGDNAITLSAVPPADAFGNSFGNQAINAGDLLMVIQIQNALFNTANSNLYGANSATTGPDGLGGTGYTNILNAGTYEFVVATNSVPTTGGLLTFSGGGPSGGLVHSYVCASGTSTLSERTFQIIRVPQFNDLTLTSNLVCPPWNGSGGGILVFDVAGTMNLNGFSIDASARGFRGGYQELQGSGANNNSVYSTTNQALAAGKGEGVAGTPRFMWNGFAGVDNGAAWNGIAGGDFGRGAPANGGGGGADHNAGGGGGGNGNFGGNGGTGWEGGGGTLGNGGRPGANMPEEVGRVYLGGGGGGGDANNATTGVKGGVGGGIIMINASTLTGTGNLISNGSAGQPGAFGSAPDGAGGGGAGGTIFINVVNPSPAANITITANGGQGGNTLFDSGFEHGPGGGGSGGFVFYNLQSATVNANVNGGAAGRANNGVGIPHGATAGLNGVIRSFILNDLPENLQGSSSACFDFPVAINDTDTIPEEGVATGTIAINDSDPNGDALTWSVLTQPDNGTIAVNANGDYTYTPNPNFTGLDTIQYFVCESTVAALCAEGQLIILVTPVNDPPIAVDDAVTIDEDNVALGTVATGDSDIEDATLTYSYVSGASNGSIVINPDGSFEYNPNGDFFGTETIVYEVCDSEGACDLGNLVVVVVPVNDPPVAQDDEYTVGNDSVLNGDVSTNDTDADNSDLDFNLLSSPLNGTITLNPDGTFVYDPNDTFIGDELLNYEVCDPSGACDVGVLIIHVIVPDTDGDGITDANELLGGSDPNDPCDPNINALSTNDCDNDGLDNAGEILANTDNTDADTDDDGVLDGDEVLLGSDPLDPCSPNPLAILTLDCDNDGLDGSEELANNTDPLDADSDNDGINDGDEVTAGSDPLNSCDPNINALATNDCDNDGLDNAGEILAGTDNTVPDTDGDGINDGDEVTAGSDPLNSCDPNINALTTNDCDNDGLDNAGEILAGTDNTVADTDGDGINDGDEVTAGSDPLNSCDPNINALTTNDCDNDGLDNAGEILAGTDNTAADTDGDGINDGDEVTAGSDPLNSCDPNINALATNDCDNDGLDNAGEDLAGSDNTNPDTDSDGINDGDEVSGGSDPTNPCDPVLTVGNDCGAPFAEDDLTTVLVNEVVVIDVLANDGFGFDGPSVGAITILLVTNGSAQVLDNGTPNDPTDDQIEFTPDLDFEGLAELEYQICDSDGDCVTALVGILVGDCLIDPLADCDLDGINNGDEEDAGSDPFDPCDPNINALSTNDCDNDGLDNAGEILAGTDNTVADTDGDGINDGDEVTAGSDPLNSCDPNISALATDDCDNDGLDNAGEILAGTDNANPDTDGDGINDGAEVNGGSNPLDPCDPNALAIASNDCDNDGLTNGEEELGGDGLADSGDETDPTDADSDNDGLNDGEEVLGVDDVSTTTVAVGTSNPLNPCDPNINALSTNDCDNDGLDNAGEILAGTDNTNPDTDGDGINDGAEVNGGSNPLDSCDPNAFAIASNDCDNDGLTNGEEELGGDGLADSGDETDPTDADSDNDGLNDGEEVLGVDDLSTTTVAVGTSNPLNPCDPNINALSTNDCDNDGLDNAGEILAGTDNANPDTDGDGINDGAEVNGGSNPLDPCDPNALAIASNDCDNDGLTNGEEELGGDGLADSGDETDPTDADSDNDGLNDGEEVLGVDDLSTTTVAVGTSNPLNPCDPNINALSTNDCDNDGLDNAGEILAGTDNTNPDTDGDGINDGSEVNGGSNPLDSCDPNAFAIASNDCDNDGLTNGEEELGGDGLADSGDETDPTDADSDNDGLNDGEEVLGVDDPSTDAVATGTSDPLNPCDPFVATSNPLCDLDDAFTMEEDGVLTGTVEDVTGLTYTVVTGPEQGVLVLNADGTFTYTPEANATGVVTVVYLACDENDLCDTSTLTITILPLNDAPDAEFDVYSTNVNTPLDGDVTENDVDPDGDDLVVSLLNDADNGSLTLNADGTFDYEPNTNFLGEDQFEYILCDSNGACDTTTVTIVVIDPNTVPVAEDDVYTTNEDTELNGNVLENDTDADGDAINATLTGDVSNGTLTLNTDGSFTYVPDADFFGTDSFVYVACDGNGGCEEATVTITVVPVNDAPVAVDDAYSGEEDDAISGDVASNDSDVDNTDFNFDVVSGPANGTVVLNSDGTFTYVPNADFFGEDTFEYQLCDDLGLCDTALVVLTIDALNDVPVAVDDLYTMDENTVLNNDVSSNDFDTDGSNPVWTIDSSPTNGTVSMSDDGVFVYVPNTDFTGSDSFTYILCDGEGDCDTATVVINVLDVNTIPQAEDDNAVVDEDSILLFDVSTNDSDADGDDLTFTILDGLGAGEGTLTMDENGVITYTPPADFNGTVDFTYTACDASNNCDTATVTIVVVPINDPPVGVDDSYTINQDTTLDNDVSENDSDVDDTDLVYNVETDVSNGTLVFNADGTFTYTPDAGYYGIDVFTYTVCDGEDCDTVTVTINIIEVIIEPQLGNDEYSTPEDVAVSGDVSANDVGTNGFIYIVSELPSNGTVVMNEDGTFTYTPNPGFFGTDTFVYLACNAEGDCYEAIVTIIVYEVEDPTDKDIAIPAGFSPNADNVGDTFIIENIDKYPSNALTIFNRWGNVVYTASPYRNDDAWDGTTETNGVVVGSKVPEGTYFYILDKGDGTEKMSGFIVVKYEAN